MDGDSYVGNVNVNAGQANFNRSNGNANDRIGVGVSTRWMTIQEGLAPPLYFRNQFVNHAPLPKAQLLPRAFGFIIFTARTCVSHLPYGRSFGALALVAFR